MDNLEFIVSKEQGSELSGIYKGNCINPSTKKEFEAEFTLTKRS